MFKYISFIITLLFVIATSPALQASNNSALIPADEEQHGHKAYQPSTVKWNKLPNEILEQIFSSLEGKDFIKLRLVCSKWNSVTKSSRFFMPENDQKNLSVIITSPQEALIKASRVLPHIIADKSRKIAEDIYPINYYEDDPLFISKWIEYITLLSFSKKCGDDQAGLILNEKLEYAIHRMDNFDAVFSDLSFDKQVSLRNALWEQAAYLDAALREKIIKAYSEGLDKWLPRNANKKKYWENYLLPYTQKGLLKIFQE